MHWFNLSNTTKLSPDMTNHARMNANAANPIFGATLWMVGITAVLPWMTALDAPNPIFGATFWTTAAVLEFIMIP